MSIIPHVQFSLHRFLILCSGFSSAKILDYTPAQIITVVQGEVAVYNDFVYLVHTTNISDFEAMLKQSTDTMCKFAKPSLYRDILNQQHEEISHIMKTLQIPIRHARSIDFLGSALKFVAGTPDHDDYSMLLTKQNILIDNNNKQNKINSALQDRINELTNQINAINSKFTGNYEIKLIEKIPLFEYLANRNNMIINYLNNIVLSIVLAKSNLINPLILDDIENLNKNENLPVSISNLLLVTKIKVLQNSDVIHYILKVPKLSQFCTFLNLYPVSHNDSIIKLPVKNAAKCENVTYPVTECVKATTNNICRPIISDCLHDLLNNDSASCATENSHHLPPIQVIDDGIIILNDVYPTTIEDKQKVTIEGTILIEFAESIKINDTAFNAKKNSIPLEAHPPKIMSMTFLEHENKISLPFLHKLNIENTNQIQQMSENLETHTTLWWLNIIIVITIVIFIILFCVYKSVMGRKRSHISAEQMDDIIANIGISKEDV